MKKGFIKYAVLWLVALGLFNAITFLFPRDLTAPSFWVGYGAVSAAFVAQLIATALVFRKDLLQKRVGKMPLTVFSVVILAVLLVSSGFLALLYSVDLWIKTAVAFVIVIVQYAVNIASLIASGDTGAAKGFVADLKKDTEALVQKAQDDRIRALAEEVAGAAASADPFSDVALAGVENKTSGKLAEFTAAVEADDAENAAAHAKQLLSFMKERNAKCRILK